MLEPALGHVTTPDEPHPGAATGEVGRDFGRPRLTTTYRPRSLELAEAPRLVQRNCVHCVVTVRDLGLARACRAGQI
jgi:hypothetical protein